MGKELLGEADDAATQSTLEALQFPLPRQKPLLNWKPTVELKPTSTPDAEKASTPEVFDEQTNAAEINNTDYKINIQNPIPRPNPRLNPTVADPIAINAIAVATSGSFHKTALPKLIKSHMRVWLSKKILSNNTSKILIRISNDGSISILAKTGSSPEGQLVISRDDILASTDYLQFSGEDGEPLLDLDNVLKSFEEKEGSQVTALMYIVDSRLSLWRDDSFTERIRNAADKLTIISIGYCGKWYTAIGVRKERCFDITDVGDGGNEHFERYLESAFGAFGADTE